MQAFASISGTLRSMAMLQFGVTPEKVSLEGAFASEQTVGLKEINSAMPELCDRLPDRCRVGKGPLNETTKHSEET
ncbi:hypothetical protein [Rhizobium laguerreae]|uniref:hypothetical protein n=1 Tax=Rhizobium laguerreae TaxID=1076926 RepID=UPI001C911540|nr:hypothetical protein [Rhizobium laguerreae]MBY3081079.1 hypothetical protein [Rhizobium laguerreae]MBY3114979.1 hypothetical protein [Rhizobium laguerreae]